MNGVLGCNPCGTRWATSQGCPMCGRAGAPVVKP